MRVLVTGGAGFIGSHVTDAMIEAGHQVSVVDSLWEHGGGRRENVNPKAHPHFVDIRSPILCHALSVEQPEVVCHLAAQHSVSISTKMPEYDAEVNILGLLKLLRTCVQYKVRKVIFSSSSATYGTIEQMPIHEETPRQPPESPYGITKLASEHYLHYWKQAYGLEYTILRYGNVYGPRQDPNGEAGVIGIFSNAILQGDLVRIDWDGNQCKDYVYVEDVARANVLALTKGDSEAYCIGTGHGTSVNALYRRLSETIGRQAEIVHAPKRPGDIRWFAFDCSKAKQELGWEAQVGLEEGLSLTVEYYRKSLSS